MALSTAGVQLAYAASTGGLNPPTTGFKVLANIVTDFPGLTSTANTIDVTPIDEASYIRYVKGLSDTGGAVDMTLNLGNDEVTTIDAVKTAATGATEVGVLWFALIHPAMTKCFMFKAEIGALAIPAVAPNGAYQTTMSVVPQFVMDGLQTKPTIA